MGTFSNAVVFHRRDVDFVFPGLTGKIIGKTHPRKLYGQMQPGSIPPRSPYPTEHLRHGLQENLPSLSVQFAHLLDMPVQFARLQVFSQGFLFKGRILYISMGTKMAPA